ncbi:MAG: UPF0280 family protein, partial [Euryarchaeota archaeon]|nr:UPF0280 family protein [Euryarchaeota archaeon]
MELFSDRILIKETNLYVKADRRSALQAMFDSVLRHRRELESYIRGEPFFLTSMVPMDVRPDAPRVVKMMAEAARRAGTGPMAAVAGTIAQLAAEAGVRAGAANVVTENGGDICIIGEMEFRVGLFAGRSPLSNTLALRVRPDDLPLGVCTSSGTVGHSVSLGNADAVTVISKSTPLADAAATAIANQVETRDEEGVKAGIRFARGIEGLQGVLIIVEDILATHGRIPEIIKTKRFDV